MIVLPTQELELSFAEEARMLAELLAKGVILSAAVSDPEPVVAGGMLQCLATSLRPWESGGQVERLEASPALLSVRRCDGRVSTARALAPGDGDRLVLLVDAVWYREAAIEHRVWLRPHPRPREARR